MARPRWVPAHWPTASVFLIIGLLLQGVSKERTLGLGWMLLPLTAALLVGMQVAEARGNRPLAHRISGGITLLLTGFIALSTAVLITRDTGAKPDPFVLFRDAIALWIANVLAFALAYWHIDGGGPDRRAADGYRETDFAFAHSTVADEIGDPWSPKLGDRWSPKLMDYLFLAFTTAMAFSPTNDLALSRRAKVLVMSQSAISLLCVAVLAARAINLL